MDYEFHEAANIFPMMEGQQFEDFVADIRKQKKLLEPIKLIDGKIVDGRNRYRACKIAKVEPIFEAVNCIDDPVAFVLSLNLHRRHLTPSQTSMVGARVREIYDKQAKERQKVRKGDQPGATVENLPQLQNGKARDLAGKAVGVSGKLIDHATKVIKHGVPELIEAVDKGTIAVSSAAVFATDSPSEQKKIVEEAYQRGRNYSKKPQEPNKPKRAGSDGRSKNIRPVTEAVHFAMIAISQLERIRKDDPKRQEALDRVTQWIKEHS